MAPRPQQTKIPAARRAVKRANTLELSATRSSSPQTQAGTPTRRQTRSSTALLDSRTSREATQDTLTPLETAALKDPQEPQNIAGLIVTKPEILRNTIEGQSPSLIYGSSMEQGQSERSISKSADRPLSSGITKSASKGRRSGQRSQSRVSAADTPNNATPATMKLAAMLEQVREGEREATSAIDQACNAMQEAKTAGKEARAVLRQVKELALEARQEALATAERALEEKQEAIATKEQALEIGQKFRYVN